MADTHPFNLVHYNKELAPDLEKLVTPPYDVISAAEQDSFYRGHPLNVIRLVLGKQFQDDTDGNNRYTRASATLNQWLQDGTLTRDDQPGIVVYQMEFDRIEGGRATLDGIVCLVKVDDYGKGKVLPHEKTYKGPKQDQLSLMRACRANMTPIHGLFGDEEEVVQQLYARTILNPPDQEVADANGTVHRTWTIQDPDTIAAFVRELKDKSVLIADGHHRYETARAFRDEMRAAGHGETGPHEWVMMYLTSMSHPGLVILPAHRMVKGMAGLEPTEMLRKLDPYFYVEEVPFTPDTRDTALQTVLDRVGSYSEVGGKFGMIAQGKSCFYLLRLKDFEKAAAEMDPEIPVPLRGLDVTILREMIMFHGLRMNGDNFEGHIEYAPLVRDVVDKVDNGEVQLGFILNPTRVDQVQTAAELGHKLPHKSTYFYPKISSGLVLYAF
ncbi:MAG: DUF1015 domain-containing protein [Desulfomonile tiedjei]|nr:DUF1015 domain-containing protein [Desulfomonile tiedjei]